MVWVMRMEGTLREEYDSHQDLILLFGHELSFQPKVSKDWQPGSRESSHN